MRILDSKDPEDQRLIQNAPTFLDQLCAACDEHFAEVRTYLDALGLPYVIDPRIVRGFDYYTRTVFEIVSPSLGAQNAVCGGGRYDGLVESLGGPPTPAIGFAIGEERFLMAAREHEEEPPRSGFQAIALGDAARAWLLPVVGALRARPAAGPVQMDFLSRRIAAQFKIADRNRARWALIVGDDELASASIVVRDLDARTEQRVEIGAGTEAGAVAGAILAAVESFQQ